MPTRGRVLWASQALECFRSQTYPNKELIIIDDADEPSFPNGVDSPDVHYYLLNTRLTVPEKRNRTISAANGEIIWHLDSDDWSDPRRMEQQVQLLIESGKQMVGYHSILFFEAPDKVAKYIGRPTFGCGTSLCYWKSWGKEHRFDVNKKIASDTKYVREVMYARQIHSVDAEQMMVARVHSENTSAKQMYRFKARTLADLPEGFPR